MLSKIEPAKGRVWYDGTKFDLYVRTTDPTEFTITDKSVIPLLVFKCDHESDADIQTKLDEVMPTALAEWNRIHKISSQRDRISQLSTDKIINIITDDAKRYSE